MLGPKKILIQQKSDWILKNILSSRILCPKKIGTRKNFVQKKFVQNFFGKM